MVHRLRSTLAVKEERRIAQFLPVGPVFAVKIKCATLFSDIESESCLTDLARPYNQDFLFGRPGTNRVADPRAAIQRFSHYFPVWTPLAAAAAVECCPIAPFQQTQRAFWQNLSRADPRQPAYAALSGPSALASRHR